MDLRAASGSRTTHADDERLWEVGPPCSTDEAAERGWATSHGKLVGVIAQADIATTRKVPESDVAEVVRSVSQPTHAK